MKPIIDDKEKNYRKNSIMSTYNVSYRLNRSGPMKLIFETFLCEISYPEIILLVVTLKFHQLKFVLTTPKAMLN